MTDLRCTTCDYLFGKNVIIRYGEMKCPKCKSINIFDYQDLTRNKEEFRVKVESNKSA